ncbi:dTMP kinase [Xylocopilactobacillus apicola]|uniref:Thymidylate kinase n=1 Tax=Xylocopilactobacillus apicola TaxID=2932184 RepID=A0AAU9D8U7_9LACO|nr:dTMP kinase [Xylocopilactobacillus apicola]BDR58775.1 thymidylate kinase [Xylocopilactobacillus apicola]
MFISFEGIDGAGKSTAFDRLKQELLLTPWAKNLVFTREPGGTKISEEIRDILINEQMDPWTEALLYAAARRQNVVEKIVPSLKSGKVVLTDRYVDSSLAYQGGGRNLGVENIAKLNQSAIQGVLPDRVVYFRIDPEISRKRMSKRMQDADRFEKEQGIFFKTIAAVFENLIAKDPARFIIIEANKSPEEVYEAVKKAVFPLIEEAMK